MEQYISRAGSTTRFKQAKWEIARNWAGSTLTLTCHEGTKQKRGMRKEVNA